MSKSRKKKKSPKRVLALPDLEQSKFDSGPLDDEETAHAADELFALLDTEENDTSSR